MTSTINARWRLAAELSFVIFPMGAMAASTALSFTAHSLNLNAGDSATLLALDAQGDAYVAEQVVDPAGIIWIQVSKMNPAGQPVASYRLGPRGSAGGYQDSASAIVIDSEGSVIVVGRGNAVDFPTAYVYGPATTGGVAFAVKLDSNLTGITSAAVIGGSQSTGTPESWASAVGIDAAGNIYVGGQTDTVDFPTTAGAYQQTAPKEQINAFLVEFAPGLNKIVFATYYDFAITSQAADSEDSFGFSSLAVDAAGDIVGLCDYSYGYPEGSYVGPIPDAAATATVVKFAPGGASVVWADTLAGLGEYSESATSLALSSGDVVVVGGGTASSPPAGALQSCAGGAGGFVAKLAGASGALDFFTNFGCASRGVYSVAVDSSNTIWITGQADSSSLPAAPVSSGSGSSYVAALAADGSSVEAWYAAGGMFGQALASAPAGPAVLGTAGFLMLSNASGGPSLLGVANAAGSAASAIIAPAELVSFYGTTLGPAMPLTAQVVNGVVESSLGGYQLLFGGVAAPLLYMGPDQINAVVPIEVSGTYSVSLTLVTPSGTFPLGDLSTRPSEPEIFHNLVSGYAAAINQDGTFNSPTHPAGAGEIVSIWASGIGGPLCGDCLTDGDIIPAVGAGAFAALPVSVIATYQFAGDGPDGVRSLEVDYAGASPGQVFGLWQVNFRLPQPLPYGFGPPEAEYPSLDVQLQVDTAISAPVPIYVTP
jgi:uncharacterized protein (TIGR03437 family)